MNQFKVGKNGIVWVSDNFKEWFGGVKVDKSKSKLIRMTLPRSMIDREILTEYRPRECTLGDVFSAMKGGKMLKNGYANIFYVRDVTGVLRAVGVHWYGGEWCVYASSVEGPIAWNDGSQVFSRNSAPKSLDQAIETVKKAGYQVSKII